MAQATEKTMDAIVSLCRRRGFIFQSSEIYGGINGFWDYGPMGTALKRNLKNAWWQDIVERELPGPDGKSVSVVGLESTIIMNPKVWEASGHIGGFNDPMVDCKDSKSRYRADHVLCLGMKGQTEGGQLYAFLQGDDDGLGKARKKLEKYSKRSLEESELDTCSFMDLDAEQRAITVGPDTKEVGTLTEPRMFNLMFETHCGAIRNDDAKAYLRPETAQGIFVNFHNVVDSSRVRVPFGIAQIGKSFRNEVTPRNFTFRSREFEQMELEFFIHPDEAQTWYDFWRNERYRWWKAIGLVGDNLILRDHDTAELAHYAKNGAGVCDVEYKFPFTDPGFGELEGVAHRSNYDLRQHAEHCGKGDKWRYLDQLTNERYFPHVIEPSAGADRGTLALICEAFTPDDSRPSKVYMNFEPRVAPIKAGIFPLVKKDGMPEIADKLYRELRRKHVVEFDEKQSIGKRYARMDEVGTPYCMTIDGETASDHAVTVRERNTQTQERIALDKIADFLDEKIGS